MILADKHEKELIKHLMKDYDRRLRPSQNASHSLSVTFGLALAQLIDVVSCIHVFIVPDNACVVVRKDKGLTENLIY